MTIFLFILSTLPLVSSSRLLLLGPVGLVLQMLIKRAPKEKITHTCFQCVNYSLGIMTEFWNLGSFVLFYFILFLKDFFDVDHFKSLY